MSLEQHVSNLKNRKDFLRLRYGAKWTTPNFILQAGKHTEEPENTIRFGYTASKKVGNAVARNRAKRRMRALVRLHGLSLAQSGYDYVMIARSSLISASFQSLEQDTIKAFSRIHQARIHQAKRRQKKKKT